MSNYGPLELPGKQRKRGKYQVIVYKERPGVQLHIANLTQYRKPRQTIQLLQFKYTSSSQGMLEILFMDRLSFTKGSLLMGNYKIVSS